MSTKVDKLKEHAQINIEDSKDVFTKVDKYLKQRGLSCNATERGRGVSTKVDRQKRAVCRQVRVLIFS